jgi:membrane associated rhomboid family serine protease
MDPEAEAVLRVARRRALADEWALVLAAEGLGASVRGAAGGFALCVPEVERERAQRALSAWERENRAAEREPLADPPLDPAAVPHALFAAAALVAFFLATGAQGPGSPWFERGSADATRVLGGEAWRAVTALTLHADLVHALGNAIAGALFGAGVLRAFGPGAGAALVLAAGVAGNYANAWAHAADHVSVGASTAVFGALGLLAGRALVRRRAGGAGGGRAAVPVAAALALLAMIGTEGERVDLWAHAFGLAAGVALGAAVMLAGGPPTRRWVQAGAGAAAACALVGAWALALR